MLVDLATRADTRIASPAARPRLPGSRVRRPPRSAWRATRTWCRACRMTKRSARRCTAQRVRDSECADRARQPDRRCSGQRRAVRPEPGCTRSRSVCLASRSALAGGLGCQGPGDDVPGRDGRLSPVCRPERSPRGARASAAEIALRMNEEVYILNDPKQQSVSDTTSAMTVGDQTRTMTGARHPRRRHRASDHHGALATRRRRIVRQRGGPGRHRQR